MNKNTKTILWVAGGVVFVLIITLVVTSKKGNTNPYYGYNPGGTTPASTTSTSSDPTMVNLHI